MQARVVTERALSNAYSLTYSVAPFGRPPPAGAYLTDAKVSTFASPYDTYTPKAFH